MKEVNSYWEYAVFWESFIHQNKRYPAWGSSISPRSYVPIGFAIKDGDMIDVSVISEEPRWDFQIPSKPEFEAEALRLMHLFNETHYFSKLFVDEQKVSRRDIFFNYSSRVSAPDSNPIVLNPDIKAQYPDGEDVLYREVQSPNGCDGIVHVLFVVEADGQLSSYENYFVTGKTNAQVAYRVLDRMPNWIPAKHNGKAVASQVDLIITT